MAISQILFCYYRIWYVAGLGLTNNFFIVEKKTELMKILDKRFKGAKIGADSSPKNTPNTIWFIWLTFPIVPEVWDIVNPLRPDP